MRKLRLELDDLQVEGFATVQAPGERGTVRGEQGTFPTWCTCVHATCDAQHATCAATCLETCPETCDDWSCAETCGFSNCETRCGAAATCRCPEYP